MNHGRSWLGLWSRSFGPLSEREVAERVVNLARPSPLPSKPWPVLVDFHSDTMLGDAAGLQTQRGRIHAIRGHPVAYLVIACGLPRQYRT